MASLVSSSATSGGMPPSVRTLFLIWLFSCARLVTASAALRATDGATLPLICGGYLLRSATSPGRAPALAILFWCFSFEASSPMA